MKIICFLSLLLFNVVCCAAHTAVIITQASYVLDSASAYTTARIHSQYFTPFSTDNTIDIGYNKNATVWCKFRFNNTSSVVVNNCYLCFNNNHLDSIELYTARNSSILLGDRTAGISPFIQTIAFNIVLGPRQDTTILVRVKKVTSYLDFNFCIAPQEELAIQSKTETIAISFVAGIVFLLLLLNTILFYLSKNKLYGYYILYSVLSTTYVLITTNYLKYCLFPSYLYFSEIRIYISSISFISLNILIMYYLNLKTQFQKLYTTIQLLNSAILLLVIMSLVLLVIHKPDLLRVIQLVAYIVFLSVYLILIYATFKCLATNKKLAVNVFLFFSPVVVWSISFLLKILAILPQNIHHNFLVYTIMYEVLLFGYVLSKEYVAVLLNNNALIKKNIRQKEETLQAITQAQIKERAAIANSIHDNFGSKLAYINQLLELNKTSQATVSINELATEVRNVSHQILPQALAHGALLQSIVSHIGNVNNNLQHKQIEVFSYDFPPKINASWVHDIYLITLELISNALKHGNATHIIIELYGYDDGYLFQYTDNGIGFANNTITKGFGLSTAQKRIENYNGTFEINSTTTAGVVVQLYIPKVVL
jgi:two-component system, sensor histidine kinase LadS